MLKQLSLFGPTGSLTSPDISLNGEVLNVDSDLEPRLVKPSNEGFVTLAAQSVGYMVLLNASAPACS